MMKIHYNIALFYLFCLHYKQKKVPKFNGNSPACHFWSFLTWWPYIVSMQLQMAFQCSDTMMYVVPKMNTQCTELKKCLGKAQMTDFNEFLLLEPDADQLIARQKVNFGDYVLSIKRPVHDDQSQADWTSPPETPVNAEQASPTSEVRIK